MSEHTVEVTAQAFEQLVDRDGIVVLDWWAEWCGPCRVFAPQFEQAAERHPEVTWGKVNVDEQEELAAAFGVQSIPTLMVFRDGVLVFERPGVVSGQVLDKLVEAVGELDMVDVKRQVSEAREEATA